MIPYNEFDDSGGSLLLPFWFPLKINAKDREAIL